ncbi:hypothetical protein Fcan01_10253 [Folsomia candida]|uniref:Uncharacterized protein n=1 Tax=Folsomia candida TaxID=158441 RepID=A0A226E956_FOLCA|nr:hypothetical protein Fcan01_10253 [Folsomia candida]
MTRNKDIIFGSIWPCLEKCDPQNWLGMERNLSTSVTLYSKSGYAGKKRFLRTSQKLNITLFCSHGEQINNLIDLTHIAGINRTYSISGMECIPTPSVRQWESIKILGNVTTTCVELHEDATCGGYSVQVRPGYPYLSTINWWGFHRQKHPPVDVRSISLCGKNCMNDNSTSMTPGWAILLILLAILFVLGFGGYMFFSGIEMYSLPTPVAGSTRSLSTPVPEILTAQGLKGIDIYSHK